MEVEALNFRMQTNSQIVVFPSWSRTGGRLQIEKVKTLSVVSLNPGRPTIIC